MFRSSLQNLPIKNKLIRLIMIITCFALLCATVISALFEIYLLKRSISENLTVLASAIATNSTASIAFSDSVSATDILNALHAEQDIELSAIYLPDNSLFAYYTKNPPAKPAPDNPSLLHFPDHPGQDGHHLMFKNNHLRMDLYHPINIDGQRQGTLFLRSNLHKGSERLLSFSVAMVIIMLFIFAVVYLAAFRLQKLITEPIHKLAQTANFIAQHKDYSIRVENSNKDEIGLFIDAFNEMLSVIQKHEAEISSHRKLLAAQVDERTRELANERDKALAATKAKSQFLANMSHEIRTPMNAMIGMLSLLENAPLPEKEKNYLDTAISSSNNLLNIINGILDFSKIEAGKLTLENINFDLCHLMREVTALFINAANQKKLELICNIPPDINCQVQGDPTRLRQVMYNLISNAVKFTPVGKVSLEVSLEQTTAQGQELKFTVTDTGIGIAEKSKPLLFNSFTQLDGSTTRKYGGTGLGLAVSKQLVELMGGEIGMQSTPGKGTLFWFKLHLRNTRETSQNHRDPADNKRAEPVTKKQLHGKILLVDDDPVNQTVAMAMLETVALQAQIASNGQQALDMAEEKNFDLILMDCQMPKMDGYQATHHIRQMQRKKLLPRTPIIGMTANILPEDKQKCLDSGMDDYLPKPINLNAFINLLELWLPAGALATQHPAAAKNIKQSAITFSGSRFPTHENLWNRQTTLANILNDENLLRKMIAIFLRQYPAQLTAIGIAIDRQDSEALRKSAHELKGSVDNFHTNEIHGLLQQLENKGHHNDFSDAECCYRRLQQLLKILAEQLNEF